jgi:hypothetical protein
MGCKKKRFQTRGDAQKFKKHIRKYWDVQTTVYQCPEPECFGGFHLTTVDRDRKRILYW